MKLPRLIEKAPRGSALITVLFISLILGLATTSLISFGMEKRTSTARMVIYNEELFAAERALDRFISQVYFVSINRVSQINGSGAQGLSGFISLGMGTVADDKFNVGVVSKTIRSNVRTAIDDSIIAEIPEVAQWKGYTIVLDSYRLVAGALAYTDSGLPLVKAFNKRPGVYVTNSVSYYQVPLLNYAIFYEPTFELDAGQRIDVYGKVHTNSDWYLTTNGGAWYHDFATVAGNFYGGVYNPLDGEDRDWWSGSNDIHLAKVMSSTIGAAATTSASIYDSSLAINHGYLSSAIYNPGNPTGNPVVDFTKVDSATGLWGTQSPHDWWTSNPAWVDSAMSQFNGHLKDQSLGVQKVKLPIGELSDPHVLVEPAFPSAVGSITADTPEQKNAKLAYKAEVVFEVTGSNWAKGGANLLSNIQAYKLVPDSSQASGYRKDQFSVTYKLPGDSATAPARTFLSVGAIYNGREEKDVYTLDIDMAKMAEYLASTSPNANATLPKFTLASGDSVKPSGIIYANIPQSTTEHGADYIPDLSSGITTGRLSTVKAEAGVRLLNVKDLSTVLTNSGIAATNGLTFATSAPLYTKGDVNAPASGTRIPLLLASDSINPLSNAFNDATYDPRTAGNLTTLGSSSAKSGPAAGASATETNAVFLTGNVPTKYGQYGGGGENFYRYLEVWGSGNTHKYRGSMLDLFYSRIATASWDKDPSRTAGNSGYYSPPKRDWGWDSNFANGNEPPGMPRSFQYAIGKWELSTLGDYEGYGGTHLVLKAKP